MATNPFVGREQELAQLEQVLVQASAGLAQVVFVAGEQAVRAVAYTEASRHFTGALAQLAALPETTARA